MDREIANENHRLDSLRGMLRLHVLDAQSLSGDRDVSVHPESQTHRVSDTPKLSRH
jgi:hypothetical protein